MYKIYRYRRNEIVKKETKSEKFAGRVVFREKVEDAGHAADGLGVEIFCRGIFTARRC